MRGNGHRTPARDSGKSYSCKQVMFVILLKEGHTVVFCTGLHTVAERDDVREDSFWMEGRTAVVYAQGQRGMTLGRTHSGWKGALLWIKHRGERDELFSYFPVNSCEKNRSV